MKVVLEYPEISEIITKAIKICEKHNQKIGGHNFNNQHHTDMLNGINPDFLTDIALNRLNQLETAIINQINNLNTVTDLNIQHMNRIITTRITLQDTPSHINRSINNLINMYESAIKISKIQKEKTLLKEEFAKFLFNNIDIIEEKEENFPEIAEQLYRNILDSFKEIKHPNTLSIMRKLIHVLNQQEKFEDAKNLSHDMLEKSKNTKNKHDILLSMKTLADIFVAEKELQNAHSEYSEALKYASSIKEEERTDDINNLIEMILNSLANIPNSYAKRKKD